jgi:hypothetical protein
VVAMLIILKRKSGEYSIFDQTAEGLKETYLEDENGDELPSDFKTAEAARQVLLKFQKVSRK